MAGQRLTDKTALANNPASDDLLMVVDVSDTTGSAEGTSKKVISEYVIATEKVTVSNAEWLLLHSTGKTLVANKGAGKVIVPISVYMEYTEGATPNTNTLNTTIGFVDLDSNYFWNQDRYQFDSPSYNGFSWMVTGDQSSKGVHPTSSVKDLGLYFYFLSAPTALSTGTINIWTTYRVIDIS